MAHSVKKVVMDAVVAGIFAGLGCVGAEGAHAETPAAAKPSPAPAAGDAKTTTTDAKPASMPSHDVPKGHVQCFGANTCKGQNGCAVTAGQIKAANEAFKNKFAASKPISCAGQSLCGSKDGFLSWQSAPTPKDCFAKGGFLFERKDGKLIVKKG